MPPPRLSVLSFGSHARLYSEDHFLRVLSPLGLTRRGLRAFLRSLSVPTLEIGPTRYIDHLSLSIALRAITRIGQPDFIAPSSPSRAKGDPLRAHATHSLDTAYLEKNLQFIIAELLYARRIANEPWSRDLETAAKDAASRLLLAGFSSLPPESQAAYTQAALSSLHDPTNPDAPLHPPPPADPLNKPRRARRSLKPQPPPP